MSGTSNVNYQPLDNFRNLIWIKMMLEIAFIISPTLRMFPQINLCGMIKRTDHSFCCLTISEIE